MEEIYPNITKTDAGNFLNQLGYFIDNLKKQNITLVARDVVAEGSIEVKDTNGNPHSLMVAGTLDLLGYAPEGNFHIYDMKTKRSNVRESDIAKWTKQLSLYKQFLEKKY